MGPKGGETGIHETIAQARVGPRHGVNADASVRIVGADALRQSLAGHEPLNCSAQVRNRAFVDGAHLC